MGCGAAGATPADGQISRWADPGQNRMRSRNDFLDRRGFVNRNWQHGSRARYVSGCHCAQCREANRLYYYVRIKAKIFGRWDGIVPAGRARRHILKLSRRGIGRRAVAAVSGVSETILFRIRSGLRRQIRASTERRILAVTFDAYSDAALVSNARTWQRIGVLLSEGFTKQELARRLGSKAKEPKLQIATRGECLARTAVKVERLYKIIMAGAKC